MRSKANPISALAEAFFIVLLIEGIYVLAVAEPQKLSAAS